MVMQLEAPNSVVFSFELVGTLKSDCLELGWTHKHNTLTAGVSGMPLLALETHTNLIIHSLVRAHIRIRSPRLAASGV